MDRVRAFFVEEATECLGAIRTELAGTNPHPDTVHTAVRRFRGSAQMARFGALADAAWSLEQELKLAARGDARWDRALRHRVARELERLAGGLDAVRAGRMERDEKEPSMDEQSRSESTVEEEVVPIEALEYSGAAALARARALRGPLEAAIGSGDPTDAILDELFDLIRLGTK